MNSFRYLETLDSSVSEIRIRNLLPGAQYGAQESHSCRKRRHFLNLQRFFHYSS
jgi:hypothetical protein